MGFYFKWELPFIFIPNFESYVTLQYIIAYTPGRKKVQKVYNRVTQACKLLGMDILMR